MYFRTSIYISSILDFDLCLLMKRSLREPYTSGRYNQDTVDGDAHIYLSPGGGGFYLTKWGAILLSKQPEDGLIILRKELTHKVKELKYMKSGSHEVEDQKQVRTSST